MLNWKPKLFIYLWATLDLLAGYGGLLPGSEIYAGAQATPANPISTQQITMPVFTLNPAPAIGASIQLSGNPGPQTIFYWVVAKYSIGNATLAGPFAITNAPNTLSGTNFVKIAPLLPTGALTYDLLKTLTTIPPGGACACAVATGVAVGTVTNDQSNATGAYTVTTVNLNVFTLSLQNEVQSLGISHLILRQNAVFVADLSTAGVTFPLLAPNGTIGAPSYSWSAETGLGFHRAATGSVALAFLGTDVFTLDANNQIITMNGAAPALFWNTDIGFTSNGSGIMRLGTTVSNNNGRLELAELNIAAFCSVNSVSPAACGTNLTGNIVIPTTTTTYTVNASKAQTTARIFLQPSTNNASFTGSPTCVAPAAGTVTISAIVSVTSFTITLPSTTGQTCWSFWIVT